MQRELFRLVSLSEQIGLSGQAKEANKQINVMSLSANDKNCQTFYWANIKNITNRWPLEAAVGQALQAAS